MNPTVSHTSQHRVCSGNLVLTDVTGFLLPLHGQSRTVPLSIAVSYLHAAVYQHPCCRRKLQTSSEHEGTRERVGTVVQWDVQLWSQNLFLYLFKGVRSKFFETDPWCIFSGRHIKAHNTFSSATLNPLHGNMLLHHLKQKKW